MTDAVQDRLTLGDVELVGADRLAAGRLVLELPGELLARDLDVDLGRQAGLLFESETSGGLLFGVAPENARLVRDGFAQRGEGCWEVGEVTSEIGLSVR